MDGCDDTVLSLMTRLRVPYAVNECKSENRICRISFSRFYMPNSLVIWVCAQLCLATFPGPANLHSRCDSSYGLFFSRQSLYFTPSPLILLPGVALLTNYSLFIIFSFKSSLFQVNCAPFCPIYF